MRTKVAARQQAESDNHQSRAYWLFELVWRMLVTEFSEAQIPKTLEIGIQVIGKCSRLRFQFCFSKRF